MLRLCLHVVVKVTVPSCDFSIFVGSLRLYNKYKGKKEVAGGTVFITVTTNGKVLRPRARWPVAILYYRYDRINFRAGGGRAVRKIPFYRKPRVPSTLLLVFAEDQVLCTTDSNESVCSDREFEPDIIAVR
jgi:hypothetical protein